MPKLNERCHCAIEKEAVSCDQLCFNIIVTEATTGLGKVAHFI
jgi:hypothetical protein